MTPSGFSRAAKRIGFKTKIVHKPLCDLNTALLPAVLILKGNKACVITELDIENDSAEVIYPELNDSAVKISITKLADSSTAMVIYAQPEFAFDASSPVLQTLAKDGWFWGVIKEFRRL